MSIDFNDLERRMTGAIDALKANFGGLRTGRASTSLLEPLTVEVYGSEMPINQVATLGTPEPRLITATVWDASNVKAVEKAIRNSNLGLNPMVDGNTVRCPLPDLNEERRQELVRVAGGYAEEGRIAVRNVRRAGMDELKKLEKDGDISEDDSRSMSERVQKLTDKYVKQVDSELAAKEGEIMQV